MMDATSHHDRNAPIQGLRLIFVFFADCLRTFFIFSPTGSQEAPLRKGTGKKYFSQQRVEEGVGLCCSPPKQLGKTFGDALCNGTGYEKGEERLLGFGLQHTLSHHGRNAYYFGSL